MLRIDFNFRSKSFLLSWAFVFLVQVLFLLLFATPMYDIDTNSFVAGGFSWDIYHNPLMNMFIAACRTILPSIWLPVILQIFIFSFSAAFLVRSVFKDQRLISWLALAVAAGEPATLFYNYTLLPESLFTSFTMLSVTMLFHWNRNKTPSHALFFGAMMGLTFLCKLSAMIHLPLFGILLLGKKRSVSIRFQSLVTALVPFAACYLFVFFGQKALNEGDIYTVEGRVRWDFSSSQYQPSEIEGDEFKKFVDPYIIKEGKLVEHRELRRELSYLGYKDCVEEYEKKGQGYQKGVNACDSIFGAVAAQIMEKHFWAAEKQFAKDNVRFVHELSYFDYRYTPGLHYYHPESEFNYIDSLMAARFNYYLPDHQNDIPSFWQSLSFGNTWMTMTWWLWWLVIISEAISWFRSRKNEILAFLTIAFIPQLFHLVYISYRPRFLAPYIVVMVIGGIYSAYVLFWKRNENS